MDDVDVNSERAGEPFDVLRIAGQDDIVVSREDAERRVDHVARSVAAEQSSGRAAECFVERANVEGT